MKKILYIFIILNLHYLLFSNEETNILNTNIINSNNILNTNVNTNQLTQIKGINSIGATIKGLSYRFWPTDLGFQLSILPYSIKNTFTINIESLILKEVFEANWSRFFLYSGINFSYNDENYSNSRYTIYNISLNSGFGFDIYITPSIYNTIFIGYNIALDINFYNSNYNSYNIISFIYPMIGIYFSF